MTWTSSRSGCWRQTERRKHGRKPITGQMAAESRLRQTQWQQHGCNVFNGRKQISNPMSFWVENDVLQYIKNNGIKICSVYGDIVEAGSFSKQVSLNEFAGYDTPVKLTTTGAKRTGCMFCGYGCQLEKPGEGRFERMKVTHPKQYEYIMRPVKDGGLGYKDVIDWINKNGETDIRY